MKTAKGYVVSVDSGLFKVNDSKTKIYYHGEWHKLIKDGSVIYFPCEGANRVLNGAIIVSSNINGR